MTTLGSFVALGSLGAFGALGVLERLFFDDTIKGAFIHAITVASVFVGAEAGAITAANDDENFTELLEEGILDCKYPASYF